MVNQDAMKSGGLKINRPLFSITVGKEHINALIVRIGI